MDAREAIKNDRITICLAGTRGAYPVGVSEAELPLIHDVSTRMLPSGCTEPKANAAIAYAKEYNTIILKHLASVKTKNG